MEDSYEQEISLDDLSAFAGLSKSYLLRSFTRQMGISPYRYLQTVRINQAKTSGNRYSGDRYRCKTGFSDQSHFTNFFRNFIGLTPKQYQRIFTAEVSHETKIRQLQAICVHSSPF